MMSLIRWNRWVYVFSFIVFLVSSGCRSGEQAELFGGPVDATPPTQDAQKRFADAQPDVPEPEPTSFCIHQKRDDLGAPVHRKKGGRGGFVRLDECTKISVIEGDSRWRRIAFPAVEGRTEGWISNRYLMSCDPCAKRTKRAGNGERTSQKAAWPPQPEGLCQTSGASGRESLEPQQPYDTAQVRGGARGIPGTKVTVLSYNVWELYDGQGEDQYLARDAHGATPAEQFQKRLDLMSRALKRLDVDIVLFQEIESAAVACQFAERAWRKSGFSCFATKRRGASIPQNIAIATRLKGSSRILHSKLRKMTGPRDVLEFSVEGAGGLTISNVHLKSSRGQESHDDCSNARQRMGAVSALVSRYMGWASVLIAGDFNVDPLDTSRGIYDRTDDILVTRGFSRACSDKQGCQQKTYSGRRGFTSPKLGSTIDLAFFKGGGSWKVFSFDVLKNAPHRSKSNLGSDHLPIIIKLER